MVTSDCGDSKIKYMAVELNISRQKNKNNVLGKTRKACKWNSKSKSASYQLTLT